MTAQNQPDQSPDTDILSDGAAKILLLKIEQINALADLAAFKRNHDQIINLLPQPQRKSVWRHVKRCEIRLRGRKSHLDTQAKVMKSRLLTTEQLIGRRGHNG